MSVITYGKKCTNIFYYFSPFSFDHRKHYCLNFNIVLVIIIIEKTNQPIYDVILSIKKANRFLFQVIIYTCFFEVYQPLLEQTPRRKFEIIIKDFHNYNWIFDVRKTQHIIFGSYGTRFGLVSVVLNVDLQSYVCIFCAILNNLSRFITIGDHPPRGE